MLGQGYIDDLARQAKSARKTANKAAAKRTIDARKAASRGTKVVTPAGYRTAAPPPVRTGYHGIPMNAQPPPRMPGGPGGYHGAPMPAKTPVVPGASPGYRTGTAGNSGPARSRVAGAPPPPSPNKTSPGFFAQHGKKVAAGVVGGGVIGGYVKNRTGKAVDPTTGLPKGVYGY